MGDQLCVAQVGVGGFGAYRRERMRETGLFKLACAYDYNRDALAACEKEDGAVAAASFENLLNFPGVEAVIIATGARFHAAQGIAAMQRGMHVFIEKPLCATPDEMNALLSAQKQTKVVAAAGHNDHASDPITLEIRRLIQSGEMGKIVSFEATTAHSGGLMIKPGDWRGDPERNPGGMLFQCGVHTIHELLFHFGPITHVSSMMRYDVHTTATADAAICHLRFASGVIGTLNAYHVTPYRHTFAVFGTKANIYRTNGSFGDPTEIQIQRTYLDGKKEPLSLLKISGKADVCGNLKSFHRAIREGGTPYPSLADGAKAVAVVFAAEESARTGKTVEVARIE